MSKNPDALRDRVTAADVVELWHAVGGLREASLPGCGPLKLTTARRRVLKARVSEHGTEAVVKVWRWALTSMNKRAVYLRDQGYVRPDTLHRAVKFPTYLEMAEADSAAAQAHPSAEPDMAAFLADD